MKSRRQQLTVPQAVVVETLEKRILLTNPLAGLDLEFPLEIPEPEQDSPLNYNDQDHEVHDLTQNMSGNGLHFHSTQASSYSGHIETGINTVDQGTAVAEVSIFGITMGPVETFQITTTTQVAGGRLAETNVRTIDGRRSQATIDIEITGHGMGIFIINTQAFASDSHTFAASYFGSDTTTRIQQSDGNFLVIAFGEYNINLQVVASTTHLDEVYASGQIAGRGAVSQAATSLDLQSNRLHVTRFQATDLISSIYEYQGLDPNDSVLISRSAHSTNAIYAVGLYSNGIKISSAARERSYSGTLETDNGGEWIRSHQLSGSLNVEASRRNYVWGDSQTGTHGVNTNSGTTYDIVRIMGSGSYHGDSQAEDSYSPLGDEDEKDQVFIAFDNLADQLFNLPLL